jgi:ubiquinone/menaquinone biosynthesis C-methylase UbiE
MMLDLAGVQVGSRVLDVAAGSGESTLMAARRIGPTGYALAADVSANKALPEDAYYYRNRETNR